MIALRRTRRFAVLEAVPPGAATVDGDASQADDAQIVVVNSLRFHDAPLPVRLEDAAMLAATRATKRRAYASRGFYATPVDAAPLKDLEAEAVARAAAADRVADIEAAAPTLAALAPLLDAAAAEAEILGLRGFATDVQVRDVADDGASAPFPNFHVDVPVLGLFALYSFCETFARAPLKHPALRRRGGRRLGDVPRKPSLRAALEADGLAYRVLGRVPCGQLNVWRQLAPGPRADPALAVFGRAASAALRDACDRHSGYSDVPAPRVAAAVGRAVASDPPAVLADNRGRALVFDAAKCLHAAAYLGDGPPRRSVEVRFTTCAPRALAAALEVELAAALPPGPS